jgi:hypothetical protein
MQKRCHVFNRTRNTKSYHHLGTFVRLAPSNSQALRVARQPTQASPMMRPHDTSLETALHTKNARNETRPGREPDRGRTVRTGFFLLLGATGEGSGVCDPPANRTPFPNPSGPSKPEVLESEDAGS